MTSKEAAQRILSGIIDVIGYYREDVEAARGSGCDSLAERYQISVDTLAMLAAGLQSSIDQGEYGDV